MEQQQRDLSAKSEEAIRALKQEIKLLRRAAALYDGIPDAGQLPAVTFKQRLTAWLARVAYGLLRFSARCVPAELKPAADQSPQRHES